MSTLARIRKICLALPAAHEVTAWEAPTFRVRNKLFAMYASSGNHHGGRVAIWCKATHIDQELLIKSDPNRYFKPPYVGPSGWVGIYLDGNPDWAAIAAQLGDAYRLIAPKRLAQANAQPTPARRPKAKARAKRTARKK
ncbi:MAG TPA: MmcQ/YjbR family DNA-binding protein [Gemmatimonadaceae bacterium]|nr:MmcQ/YjbR family DNA-binding protein [Gemmatimonadaceae bacterium]